MKAMQKNLDLKVWIMFSSVRTSTLSLNISKTSCSPILGFSLSVSEMCLASSETLRFTANAEQGLLRRIRDVCFCLGRPGLQQCDRPSRPQEGLGTVLQGGLPEGQPMSLRKPGRCGATQAWSLGSVSPCCGHRSVHVLFLYLFFFFSSEMLLQKAAPGALCRPVEGSRLFGVVPLPCPEIHLQLSLVIHGFHIYKFSFLITNQPVFDCHGKTPFSLWARLFPLSYGN